MYVGCFLDCGFSPLSWQLLPAGDMRRRFCADVWVGSGLFFVFLFFLSHWDLSALSEPKKENSDLEFMYPSFGIEYVVWAPHKSTVSTWDRARYLVVQCWLKGAAWWQFFLCACRMYSEESSGLSADFFEICTVGQPHGQALKQTNVKNILWLFQSWNSFGILFAICGRISFRRVARGQLVTNIYKTEGKNSINNFVKKA